MSEECRDARGTLWLESILQDVRLSLRALRKGPGFAIAAIGTLALGIGANTAIFHLLDVVRLRTLPVKDPQRLAMVQLADRTGWRGSQATPYEALTNPIWERFRDTQQAFSSVLAWANTNFGLTSGGETRPVRGLFVSGAFFQVLGVEPVIGRTFSATDDRRGCGVPGAVISYSFWQRELGGDPDVIGRKLTLNFQKVDVIGVTPADFSGLEIGRSYDVAVPICSQATLWNAGNWLNEGTVWWLTVMGRLTPGETFKEASTKLRAVSPALFQTTLPSNYPAINVKDYLKFKLTAVPAHSGVSAVRDQYGVPLLFLLATTGVVLLIACANLANLILARATAREHEFAVRLAIGASRRRLVQQLLTEGVLLAAAGALAGLLVSSVLSRFLVALLSTKDDPLFLDLRPDWQMLVFTIAVAGLTCILFGLTPALQATNTTASEAMKTGSRTLFVSRGRFGLRQVLVVSQVALSLVLVVSALLFSGSLRNLLAVDAGFRQNGILIANIDFSRLNIPVEQRIAFRRNLLQRIRALPGVSSAAEAGIVPLSGGGLENLVWKDGLATHRQIDSDFNSLGEGYLKTLGMPLLAGRDFNDHDTSSSPRVAIVNQTFARKLRLGVNPVGQRFRREATPSEPEQTFEIVGFVRDTKYYSLREEMQPIAFLAIDQQSQPDPFAQILIRSNLNLTDSTSELRKAIGQVSPIIGIDFRSLKITIRERLMREQLMATLSGFFGIVAVLIAAIGLYGVMSYMVIRRTSEIGVRIALGAARLDILTLVMRQAGLLLAMGVGVGAALALAVTGTARSMLYGLTPYDARTIAFAAGLLVAITTAASFIPARRAAQLEPMTALREE